MYRVFPGSKVRPGRDADPSPPSSAEVKNRLQLYLYSILVYLSICGPGSVVGIAIAYGLDGPGIESRWGEIFRTCPDRP